MLLEDDKSFSKNLGFRAVLGGVGGWGGGADRNGVGAAGA